MNLLFNIYKCFYKFNKPELEIYNKLVEMSESNPYILYVFNHFTLPISRNGDSHLYADFFIIFEMNDNLEFAIIEFDGPTHYNINNNWMTKERIYCDIIKNNFCIRNSIHILRVYDYDDYMNKINKFIKEIIKENGIITILPSYDYYLNLLETIK